MRIALIGGKGGVARSLVAAWKHDHQLVVLDRSTAPLEDTQDARIEEIHAEATDAAAVARAVEGAEAVVHLAALLPVGSEAAQLEQTAEAIAANVGSVLLALRLARRAGVGSFVHISSLSVYERYLEEVIPADAPADAHNLYGFSKRLAEQALRWAAEEPAPTAEEGAIQVTSLRLAFPTTAEVWPEWEPPAVIGAGRALKTMADGTPHCALHPEDLADGVLAAIHRRHGGPYAAIALSAAPHAHPDDSAERLLDWRPRHTLMTS